MNLFGALLIFKKGRLILAVPFCKGLKIKDSLLICPAPLQR